MTDRADLRAWLVARGCVWAGPTNAGAIDYAKAAALTGYAASTIKAILYGRRKVPKPLASRIEAEATRAPALPGA